MAADTDALVDKVYAAHDHHYRGIGHRMWAACDCGYTSRRYVINRLARVAWHLHVFRAVWAEMVTETRVERIVRAAQAKVPERDRADVEAAAREYLARR